MIPQIRFIEPGAALIKEKDLVRKVELAYRICYKSEDKVSETSKSLVQRLANSRKPDRHTSPLEHAWIRIKIPSFEYLLDLGILIKDNPYIKDEYDHENGCLIGNFRAFHDFLINHTSEEDGKWVSDYAIVRELGNQLNYKYPEVFPKILPAPEDKCTYTWDITEYDRYKTFRIVTSRDILQELARHRTMSFSVESTRYCNYGNKGYQFVIPRPYGWAEEFDWEDSDKIDSIIQRTLIDKQSHTVNEKRTMYDGSIHDVGVGVAYTEVNSVDAINNVYCMKATLIDDCYLAAARYEKMLTMNVKPQCARMLLPGALKTELFMTGTDEAWNHFLTLRDSEAAHPQMRYIAQCIKLEIENDKLNKECIALEEERDRLLKK